ncbi:MAG: class I SAM-dependent methyltransferase [Pseudoxanthomonas sp.]
MNEPHLSQFVQLIRQGAATWDVHDSDTQHRGEVEVSEEFLARELARVEAHARNLCVTLVDHLGQTPCILDVGCGTGGGTVAMALSELKPERIIGVDADPVTLQAARVRAQAYGLPAEKADFQHVRAGNPLPFQDGTFDLVTCVSVLEFVTTVESRERFVAEMLRVTRPEGHLFLATPNPFVLRDYHSRRWLGDWIRRPDRAWSSTPVSIGRMLAGTRRIPLARYRLLRHARLRHVAFATPVLQWLLPWQQWLVQKPKEA